MEAHSQPIQFTLVADVFGNKYVIKRDTKHLLNALKGNYKVKLIGLADYIAESHLTGTTKTDMPTYPCQEPRYIKKQLQTIHEHIQ